MNINTFTPQEAIEVVMALEDITEVRQIATQLKITYSGNSGIYSLKIKIIDKLNESSELVTSTVNLDVDEPIIDELIISDFPDLSEVNPNAISQAIVEPTIPIAPDEPEEDEPIQVAIIPKKKAEISTPATIVADIGLESTIFACISIEFVNSFRSFFHFLFTLIMKTRSVRIKSSCIIEVLPFNPIKSCTCFLFSLSPDKIKFDALTDGVAVVSIKLFSIFFNFQIGSLSKIK